MSPSTDGRTPVEDVIQSVGRWRGVTLGPHPYDGVEFLLEDYEFGHIHRGWESVHVNYPRRMRDALIEEGRTDEHPTFSNSGWTSRPVSTAGDAQDARWLLRVSYLYRASTRRENAAAKAARRAVDVAGELAELGVSPQVRGVFDDVTDVGVAADSRSAPLPGADSPTAWHNP